MIVHRMLLALTFCALLLATSAQAWDVPRGCHSVAGGTAMSPILLIIVDRTARRDDMLIKGIISAVGEAIRPGVRIVLSRVGGIHPLPQVVVDVTMPDLQQDRADLDGLVTSMFMKAGQADRNRECVLGQVESERKVFIETLRNELQMLDSSTDGASPILLSLSQALAPFGREAAEGRVTVLVISDAIEHTNIASFYPKGRRYLTPAEALAHTRRIPGSWKGAKILFAGLGVTTSSDIDCVSSLIDIWREIIIARGGIPLELSTTSPQRLRERLHH